MLEFFIALFGVPYILVRMMCEYRDVKNRDKEIKTNASLYSNNVSTWIRDVVDVKYERELKEYYNQNGGYKQLWNDARNIICPSVAWYREREYPPPGASYIPTLCYMIIMSYNSGKLPEMVAKRGIVTVNYKYSSDRIVDDIVFSQTMWWVGEQLKKHGITDRVVMCKGSETTYLTEYNRDAPHRAVFKWERMIHPCIKIK